VVTDHLVEASLAGVDSHGIMRVPEYVGKLKRWRDGETEARINPRPNITIFNETETTAMLDGDWCFGQVCATRAMEMAIQKARMHNVGVVTGRNTDHIGRAAAYPLIAAEAGMVGLIFVKVNPVMVPHGGISRLLGNNPISVAIPTGGEWPIFVDVAMSVVAGGKILIAMERGESIPEEWALDSKGNPTRNPRDYIENGALLPVGQHKGYALAVVNEVLGGLMSGAGTLFRFSGNNAFMCMALNIRAFAELSDFQREVRQMISDIKGSAKAPQTKEILIPGEPEFLTKKSRVETGIPLPDKTWMDILKIASEFNLQFEGSAKQQEG
jgi:uncharacterized oxidoreductase